MKKEIKVWALAMVASFMVAAQSNAQQDSLAATTLDDVVITATKFPKSQSETGKVLTVIDETQLSRSQGKDLSQLLNEQVGLIVNGANSNPGKDKSVFLRGAGGQYTLVLIDGVPMHDPSGVGGAFDPRMVPIDLVERIEILKGSQSTLYGTDAIAGVINIITKQKAGTPVSGFGTISYGSYNSFKGNVGVAGNTKRVEYNVSYTRFQSDGLSEAKDETGLNNFDKDGFDQDAIQFNMGWRPAENLVIKPFFRFTDFNGKYDAGAFMDDPLATYSSGVINYGVNSQFNFSKGTFTALYAHTGTDRTFTDAFSTYPYDGRFDHGEMFMSYAISSHLQVLGGLCYQHFKMIDANATEPNPSSDMVSPYLSLFVRKVKGFSAELGGRFVSHSEYGKNFTISINPSWMIGQRVKVFANYTTGFKAPTLSQLYGPFGANPDLGPEESQNLEAGAQYFSSNRHFDMRVAVFNRKIDNAIAYTSRYENLNTMDDRGVEVEASYKYKQLTLNGQYAFVEGEFTTYTSQGPETKNNDLLRRPGHSGGLSIGFKTSDKIFASANFRVFGKRNDLFFDTNTFTNVPVELGAYRLLDLYVEYSIVENKLKVFVDARNILNESYFEVYGYTTQKFNVVSGVSVKW